jgi:pSer/pThr/pTyr-binding forkhead associated (FHA) protein
MGSSFRIVLRSGPTPGKVFPLGKSELFIGRDLSNDVVINDPEISRRHTRLFSQSGT